MKNVVDFLVSNWTIIVATLVVITIAAYDIYVFSKMSLEKQKTKVKECLLAWVVKAEKDLGSGTGKIKLSVVYGYFITAFPVLKNFISFDTFHEWVVEALDQMEDMLENNQNLKDIVSGNVLISAEPLQEIQEFPESKEDKEV